MKTLSFKKLHDFCESEEFKILNEKSLCILDIDGIFFEGLTDPHFWFSNIKKEYLEELEKIEKTKSNIWIFTDRNLFGFWGPYKKQLLDVLSENGRINVRKFKGSKEFLDKAKELDKALIINAKKPGEESQKVLIKGLENFEEVFYFASQDIPFKYDDKTLVEKLKCDKIHLYFIDIRK